MAKLGQHFLINKSKLEKIANSLEVSSEDFIIEIGPGHGELTRELEKLNAKKIIAVEKDKELAQVLKEKFLNHKNIEIIEGDALKVLPQLVRDNQLMNCGYKVVGNIPYYISGYLFRILSELEKKPSKMVFLIQKEVAQRICAVPPKMNLLSASIKFWAEPKIIISVSRRDFRPMPKVESAVIKIATKEKQLIENKEKYYDLIKSLFKQPRKTILNNLFSAKLGSKEEIAEKLKKIGINSSDRPQNLAIEEIIQLSTLF